MAHEIIHVGLIVIFGVVMLPVYAMLIGWFVGKPNAKRTSILGLGYLLGFMLLIIVGTWIAGQIIGLIMYL